MDEKKVLKLKVLESTVQKDEQKIAEEGKSVVRSNHTNPIFKKLMKFSNSNIGEGKFSIRDLLR